MLRIVFRTIPTKKFPLKSHNKEFKCLRSLRTYSSKPICPPPPPKKKSAAGKITFALGAIALGCGATIWYAGQDRDFRENLVSWLPFIEPFLQTVYGERALSIPNPFESVTDKLKKKKKKGDSGTKQTEEDTKKEYTPPTPILPLLDKDTKKEECYTEIRIEKKEAGEDEPSVSIVDPKPVGEPSATDHKALEDLEEQICEVATEAVNAYQNAIYLQKLYNQEIEIIIENNVDSIAPQTWDSVKEKTKEKNEALKEAEEKAAEANKKVKKLKELISAKEFEAPESTKILVRNNITKVQDDINHAKRELEQEKKRGSVTQKYWDKVEKARKQFSDELSALFPDIDISHKHLTINEEDLDLFLLHVYATVLFYQKELAKVETVGREKIKQAYEDAKAGKGGSLTPAEFCELMEQEKRKLTLCFQQQCLKLRKETEDEMRDQMKRQSQAFSDHLDEAIRTRELEIERELSRKFDEQLEEERCKFKIQLAAMVGRLRGLEHAMKARRDADSTAKQAQVLWSACQALTRSLRAGCPGIPWKEQIRPLEPELDAVQKAAGVGDDLVKAVLSGIPEEAKSRGVFPEDALRERFLKVEKVARNVALVPEGGASLPVHFLSYIQGLFLLKAASPIPQAELNDEETDFGKLNTNDILQRARYWIDRGNFEQTLKYMNLLRGAPRCVARQWMNETRILLETQQAANTLMAHAASSGLNYL